MAENQPELRLPRNRLARMLLRGVGRLLVALLTRTRVRDAHNFPASGPLIVVGNHVGIMEVLLMAVLTPWPVEFLGVGDIPPDPAFVPLLKGYGYIPIKRGQMDRQALQSALQVLEQGGVVGIFPEGGIWSTNIKKAHSGVAWLSLKGNAPVLPVGFGGVAGAFQRMMRLGWPKMQMNIGELMPPVQVPPEVPQKAALEQASQEILDAVVALIPQEDITRAPARFDETFDVALQVLDEQGRPVESPPELSVSHAAGLGLFFFRPVLLDVFARNLKRPVQALQRLDQRPSTPEIATALEHVLSYLEQENPYFLTYRFGNETGFEMQAGLKELHALSAWVDRQGWQLLVQPVYRYRSEPEGMLHEETNPGFAHQM